MKIIAAPVAWARETAGGLQVCYLQQNEPPETPWDDGGEWIPLYAATPPQPEPTDHLADPDSLERARNALRAITNAGSIGQAKRIAMQALGDGDQNDAPAAPASTLPLSVERVEEWRRKMHRKIFSEFCGEPNEAHWLIVRDSFNSLCDQALRAIELKKDLEVERAGNKAVYERAHMLEQQLAGLKSEWFHRGQESVQRKNESGCCCKIDDDDKILSACNAHAEWAKQQLAEKDREIAELRRGISLCAELAELRRGKS